MLLLTVKIEKAYKIRNFFLFTRSTKFPPFFQPWSLVRGQTSRMLIAFFHFESHFNMISQPCSRFFAYTSPGARERNLGKRLEISRQMECVGRKLRQENAFLAFPQSHLSLLDSDGWERGKGPAVPVVC